MAKLIFNGQEIADVTYSGGGGGSGLPTFTETVIATGTSAGTLTFTDDYHDYPLLVIRITNSSSDEDTDLLVTPDLVDSVFDLSRDIVVNEFQNNQYANYAKTSATVWTRTASRNVYISEVIGLTCDNYTVEETELYNKGYYDTQDTTISGTDLFDYDLFVIASSVDGIQPNSIVTQKPIGLSGSYYKLGITPYNRFSWITVTDTELSLAPYHYVSGIKFT